MSALSVHDKNERTILLQRKLKKKRQLRKKKIKSQARKLKYTVEFTDLETLQQREHLATPAPIEAESVIPVQSTFASPQEDPNSLAEAAADIKLSAAAAKYKVMPSSLYKKHKNFGSMIPGVEKEDLFNPEDIVRMLVDLGLDIHNNEINFLLTLRATEENFKAAYQLIQTYQSPNQDGRFQDRFHLLRRELGN